MMDIKVRLISELLGTPESPALPRLTQAELVNAIASRDPGLQKYGEAVANRRGMQIVHAQ